MASGFSFFSSPPHPTSDPWPRSANLFFTPQQQTSRSAWTTAGNTGGASFFAPPSPSPLRTSRNANLMSSPFAAGHVFNKHSGDETGNENVVREPLGQLQDQENGNESNTPNAEGLFSSTTATTPIFSFGATNTTITAHAADGSALSNRDRAVQFQFSARARSSSPSALLQSHTKDTRNERKRLFLDRLRNKRDDARSDRAGDQVLRLDFMKERRKWEDEKARWGVEAAGDVDVDVDVDADDMVDVGFDVVSEGADAMSPTEEKEIEELARDYYSLQHGGEGIRGGAHGGEGGDNEAMDHGFEEFSDDGYDEAFMQMLSQESGIPPHEPVSDNATRDHGHGLFAASSSTRSRQHLGAGGDSEMDMS